MGLVQILGMHKLERPASHRCSEIGSQRRLQLAKLLFKMGTALVGSPMLFELVTVLPDLSVAASSLPAGPVMPFPTERHVQLGSADSSQNEPLQHVSAKTAGPGRRRQQHWQAVGWVKESAMLQVTLLPFWSTEARLICEPSCNDPFSYFIISCTLANLAGNFRLFI
jgi:hypothetical protein